MLPRLTIVCLLTSQALAQINPLTLTSVSPAESSALYAAGQSYGSRLLTDAALTSIVGQLATNTAALNSFTSVFGYFTGIPTGSSALDAVNSRINVLPTNQASLLRSILTAEISIASSVVNNLRATLATGATEAVPTAASTSTPTSRITTPTVPSSQTPSSTSSSSSATTSNDGGGSGGSSNAVAIGAGVGGGVGGAIVLVAVGFGLLRLRRKRKQRVHGREHDGAWPDAEHPADMAERTEGLR